MDYQKTWKLGRYRNSWKKIFSRSIVSRGIRYFCMCLLSRTDMDSLRYYIVSRRKRSPERELRVFRWILLPLSLCRLSTVNGGALIFILLNCSMIVFSTARAHFLAAMCREEIEQCNVSRRICTQTVTRHCSIRHCINFKKEAHRARSLREKSEKLFSRTLFSVWGFGLYVIPSRFSDNPVLYIM